MANKRQINLLKITSFEHSTTGKLISWASNVGRWVVVLTEFIVISAFLSRFYFDTKLANLFDDVRQKKAIVNSSYAFEDQYRQAQTKLIMAKIILAEQSNTATNAVNILAQYLPLDTTLTSLSIEENLLVLNGYSLSTESLQVFINGISNDKHISNITIGKLGSRPDGLPGISFAVTAKVEV